MQVSSTISAVTLSLLIADRATIPHLKGDNEGFHMRYSSMIWCKRLQSDRLILPLNIMPLVDVMTLETLIRRSVESAPHSSSG